MEEDNFNNAVFTVLKPVCDCLIVDASEKSVNDLIRVVETLPPKAIQKFQKYICFPIELQIIKSSSNQQKQLLVDLLAKVLSRCYIHSSKDLLKLAVLLFQQVTTNIVKLADVSEELKLSVVECIIQLWKSAMSDVLYEVYCKETYPRLSSFIYMLVQMAKNEKLIKLRVSALDCLQVLCQVHTDADVGDVELRQRVRHIASLMLPGIVTCCFAIASEPATLNHKVTCSNIDLWSGIVGLTMSDEDSAQSADWLKETAEKLTQVSEAVLRAQTHTHWQVRQHLAAAAHSLLTSCPRNLSGSVGSLVCCLIVLSEDEITKVSIPASEALTQLSTAFLHDTGQSLLQLVESAFYSLLSRAPRIMQGTDENSQLTCLSLLVGYLRLQGSKLSQVLTSGAFLHRFLVTLAHISRLETSHVTLLEDCSVKEVETEVVSCEPWKQLMFLNTAQKARRLQELCSVLRQYADISIITYALLDLLDSNPELSKEIILLLNNILAGGDAESIVEESELVKTVVNVYLQPRLWNVPFSVSEADINVSEAQSNVVQVSLLADGLGLLALAVGGKNFSLCLLRCLYPLLECAGSPLHILSSAGLAAVQNVAQACVGGGVTELVCANVDYLSHHITLRLRRAHQSPGVLSVLSVVMRHTSLQVLPSLREIIEDVLAQSCDEFQEHNTNGFLRVFLTFVTCVRSWQLAQTNNTTSENKTSLDQSLSQLAQLNNTTSENKTSPDQSLSDLTASPAPLLDQLLEYSRLIEAADSLDDDEPVEENITADMFTRQDERIEEEEPEEEKPKPVSPSVQLTVAVLQRALHFLPSKDEQRQILVLDILKEGMLVLSSDEDQLLPLVHKTWSPLVNRFQVSMTRPLVMHRAFLLLSTLASTAREFIRSRTLKQVLPSLCQVLRENADASLLKDAGSAYRLTQRFKLQRALLAHLGSLVADLGLQEREVHQLLDAASPYLSTCQPAPLQECCVQLFKEVGVIYPDLVWLQLVALWYPTSTLEPPSPHFRTIQLETCCDKTSKFKKNVSEFHVL